MNQQPEVKASLSRRESNRLEAFPTGWFVLCFSEELKPGAIKQYRFMGQDVVAFRTEQGVAHVSDAFCPHMGANFAHGGSVDGETIKCPFHGFCFDGAGKCTKTAYGTKPPQKARLRMWHIKEMNDLILIWHHQYGLAPYWDVPPLDDAGWTKPIFHEWELQANPYDTAENSVDLGHLSVVHGYRNVEVTSPLHTEGPLLEASYAMDRSAGVFAKRDALRAQFSITKWGLGYTSVEVQVPQFGLRSRHFVFPVTVDEDKLRMRIAISLNHVAHPEKINPILRLIPRAWLHWIILKASMRGYKADVRQDFEIWKNKTNVETPALAEGDGPIMAFRRWTKQFDPRTHSEVHAVQNQSNALSAPAQ